ncbi:MAG: hypothetical protein WA087_03760 [Candidatus Saccharimonadales bacterium]
MSRQNPILHFHINSKKKLTIFDHLITFASFIYPLMAVPQVLGVYSGNVAGVSVISWVGFLFFSVMFFTYGMIHRIKPMIISNSIWMLVDGSVVIGLIINSTIS